MTLICLLPAGAMAQNVQMEALNPAAARLIRDTVREAERTFARMPQVRLTSRIDDLCGGDADTNRLMRYCTDENAIYVAHDLPDRVPEAPAAAYLLAHLYGHAVQVRHGQASRALAAIRAAPEREAELRAQVAQQVDCIAGFLHVRATGYRGGFGGWFAGEPFTGTHWGRTPLAGNAQVGVGRAAREQWFRTGQQAADLSACAQPDLDAGPLLGALR